jgi:uncharacterized membrane protein
VGAVGGAMLSWKKHGHGRGGRGGEDFGLMAFSRTLPDERRLPIRKALREQRASLKPVWGEVEQARAAAGEVLAQEPFDKEKLREALGKISAIEARLKSAGHEMFLDTAERLTADERRALKEWWQKRRGHRYGRAENKAAKDTPAPSP